MSNAPRGDEATSANPFSEFITWLQDIPTEKAIFLRAAPASSKTWGRLQAEGHGPWTRRQSLRLRELQQQCRQAAIASDYPTADAFHRIDEAFEAARSLLVICDDLRAEDRREAAARELEALQARREEAVRTNWEGGGRCGEAESLERIDEECAAISRRIWDEAAPVRGELRDAEESLRAAAERLGALADYLEARPGIIPHGAASGDQDEKAAVPISGRAVEQLLGAENQQILSIATRADMTSDEKMYAIHKLDRGSIGWDSPRWAELLNVTAPAIRQNSFWQRRREFLEYAFTG